MAPGLCPAASVTKQLKMRGFYLGTSEWLIYGKVKHVIAVLRIDDLRKYLENYSSVSRTLETQRN